MSRLLLAALFLVASCGKASETATDPVAEGANLTDTQALTGECVGGCEEPEDEDHCWDARCRQAGLATTFAATSNPSSFYWCGTLTTADNYCFGSTPVGCLCCPEDTCPIGGACTGCSGNKICNIFSSTCTSCTGGKTACDTDANGATDTCVNTNTDEDHCGACNNACSGSKKCCGGSCVDTGTDDDNCGSCGNRCFLPEICDGGTCKSGGFQ